jgi:hypothetical protein
MSRLSFECSAMNGAELVPVLMKRSSAGEHHVAETFSGELARSGFATVRELDRGEWPWSIYPDQHHVAWARIRLPEGDL